MPPEMKPVLPAPGSDLHFARSNEHQTTVVGAAFCWNEEGLRNTVEGLSPEQVFSIVDARRAVAAGAPAVYATLRSYEKRGGKLPDETRSSILACMIRIEEKRCKAYPHDTPVSL